MKFHLFFDNFYYEVSYNCKIFWIKSKYSEILWNKINKFNKYLFSDIHIYIYIYTHTLSINYILSTWCFEHPGDISCSLLVNPTLTDDFWEWWNTCLWIYTLRIYSLGTLENTDENRIFFVRSPHHMHFDRAQQLVLWALWWRQSFSTR